MKGPTTSKTLGQGEEKVYRVVDEFIGYLANIKNYSSKTVPMYRCLIETFIRQEKIQSLADIDFRVAENYLAKRKAAGISQNTNASFMNCLRAFLMFTNRKGYTNLDLTMFETPKRVRTRVELLTATEVNLMVQSCTRERDRLMILILYTSGARAGELMQLTVESLKDNKFTVIAKGNKPHVYYFDPVVAERLREFLRMECITEGPVFRKTNGKPVGQATLAQVVKKAVKSAGLNTHVYPHMFRHGFATSLLENGADVRTVQEMLGHEQIQTTMRYLHVTDSRMKETHERFAPKVMTPVMPTFPQEIKHNRA